MTTVAALYVEKGGCYFGLPDVDPWDEERDARLYAGPWPVVAHPPCGPWGVFARQGKTIRALGDDDGCFESALSSVRAFGGVLEHPAGSSAFLRYGLMSPAAKGWQLTLDGGWVCEVNQGGYGNPCRKPTWLYAVTSSAPPAIIHGRGKYPVGAFDSLGKSARARTPIAFRDLLLAIARSARRADLTGGANP